MVGQTCCRSFARLLAATASERRARVAVLLTQISMRLIPVSLRLLRVGVGKLQRALAPRSRLHLTGPWPSYEAARMHAAGYQAPAVLEKVESGFLDVVCGRAGYERDGMSYPEGPADLPIRTVLHDLLRPGDTVVDVGGGLGGLFLNLPGLLASAGRRVVVEQPLLANRGRELSAAHGLAIEFAVSLSDLGFVPDVVVLSSVLAYVPEPFAMLAAVAGLGPRTILVDRTPITRGDDVRWYVQENPGYYRTEVSYPIGLIPAARLKSALSSYAYQLSREWVSSLDVRLPPHRGYLFQR